MMRRNAANPVLSVRNSLFSAGLGVAAALALWTLPTSIPAQSRHALAISALVLVFWMGRPFPHAISGLIGCYLFWALAGVPFATAFSGFANMSAWFVFAAGIFGVITTQTRLAHRLAAWLIGWIGASYSRLVLSFILTSFILNFLVPSGIARVIILGGIGLGVVKSLGWGPEALPARGLFVIITVSSALFDKLMVSGGTSIVAQGIIEKVGQTPIYWSQWILAHAPTIVLSIFACWAIILWLFPAGADDRERILRLPAGIARSPWTASEKRWAVFLAVALGLWVTDSWHHIPPAMVAVGIALAALLPRIGAIDMKELEGFNIFPFLFSASALSLAETLTKTGVLDIAAKAFNFWPPSAGSFLYPAAGLYGTGVVYHLLVPSDPATVASSMPTLMNLALTHGWSPVATGLTWMLALTTKLFVYQSAVSIAGFSFGYFRPKDFFKVGISLVAVEFGILFLLVLAYWPLIGLIK
jgi:di/tricarboxylate transporter